MLLYVLIAIGGAIALGLAFALAVSIYASYWLTQTEREPVYDHPSNHGIAYEEVSFPSRYDRVHLHGWYLPSASDSRCVIMIQGEGHHRNSPGIRALELGKDMVERDFSVLLFDFRGRGESAGRRSFAGYREQWDVWGAIDYVNSRSIPTERIGLHGFSLGAGVAIIVAEQEPRIPAVVADSTFLDTMEDLRGFPILGFALPGWFALVIVLAGRLFFGMDLAKVRPIKSVRGVAPRPIFFIHGENDRVVSPIEAQQLYEASGNKDNIAWIVPGAGHVRSYARAGKEYSTRVADFFEHYMIRAS